MKNMSNEELFEKAKEAIAELFSDMSVSQSTTRKNLNALVGEIEILLDTLDLWFWLCGGSKMNRMTVKQWIGMILKIGLAVIVLSFEVTLSLEFFTFVYPPRKMVYGLFGSRPDNWRNSRLYVFICIWHQEQPTKSIVLAYDGC